MENETTIVYWDYRGIMEKKMDTILVLNLNSMCTNGLLQLFFWAFFLNGVSAHGKMT